MDKKQQQKTKVLIIGAGTAGLSALRKVSDVTDDFLVVDPGPLGSTCARTGCMPSKVLIEIAEQFYHSKHQFNKQGILGSENLRVSMPKVLERVRELRDFFTSGIIKSLHELKEKYICGQARFLSPNTVAVNELTINAEKIIIATGSSPTVPEAWKNCEDRILTTDTLFEQSDLCKNMAVIGAGPIGIELGQALSRLGINVIFFHSKDFIGGITDPVVNDYAIKTFRQEFQIYLNEKVEVRKNNHDLAVISTDRELIVDQLLASIGRHPNLKELGLDQLGLALNKKGVPEYDKNTSRIKDTSIYIAGDASSRRPILHEAADEGYIAGYNAARSTKDEPFYFRVPMDIVFSQPNIAKVGLSYKAIQGMKHVVGEAYFDNQGRARIMSKNRGVLRIYADASSGLLLGSEMFMPRGEHMAHLLAWAIAQNLTVLDVLKMPFYHPTIEEGVRTALQDAFKKLSNDSLRVNQALCNSVGAIELNK